MIGNRKEIGIVNGGRKMINEKGKEIMINEKDREIWVGENRLFLAEDNILYVALVGEVDEKIVIPLNETYIRFMDMVNGKLNCLVDLNKAGKQSSEVRKKANEILDNERIGKIAFFGLDPVSRVLGTFIIGFSKKKDLRFFKNKEEALAWLKQ